MTTPLSLALSCARRAALLTALALPAAAAAEKRAPPATPGAETDRPSVSVALARQAIRENDSVELRLWFRNEKSTPLLDVKLHTMLPEFVFLHDPPCDDTSKTGLGSPIDLGAVQGSSVATRSLCLRSEANIAPGDYNLVFGLAYAWQRDRTRQESFVALEKPLQVRLFGSESVAGIPLSLAAFIVPGLLFWLVLSKMGVSWAGNGIALGDRMLYSVLASIALFVVADWIGLVDADAAIGIEKLTRLAAIGFGAGLLGGAVHWLVVRWRTERGMILPSDDDATKLIKLLRANPKRRTPSDSVLEDKGVSYTGSLAARMGDMIWLAGRFRLKLDPTHPATNRIWRKYQAGNLGGAIKAAHDAKLKLEVSNGITKVDAAGAQQPTGEAFMAFGRGEIRLAEEPKSRILQVDLSN